MESSNQSDLALLAKSGKSTIVPCKPEDEEEFEPIKFMVNKKSKKTFKEEATKERMKKLRLEQIKKKWSSMKVMSKPKY